MRVKAKVQLSKDGRKFVKIGRKRYYFPKSHTQSSSSASGSKLTERELILQLVKQLTKKRRRKTSNSTQSAMKSESSGILVVAPPKVMEVGKPPVNRAMDLLLLKTLEDMKRKPEVQSVQPMPALPPPLERPEEVKDASERLTEGKPLPSSVEIEEERPKSKIAVDGEEIEYDSRLNKALKEELQKTAEKERKAGLIEGEAQRMAEERYFKERNGNELLDFVKYLYGEAPKNNGARATKQQLIDFLKQNGDEEYLKEIERLKSEILPNLKTGKGRHSDFQADGTLSTIEINHMMRHRRSFKGAVPRDGILSLIDLISPKQTSSFIVNTDPSSRPGQHWVAVMILPKTERILYFDSFGERMPSDMKRDVRVLAEKAMPGGLPILKENLIKFQRANSNNCGFFAKDFIEDILDGETFPDATGFSQVIKGERDIKKYKIKKFKEL